MDVKTPLDDDIGRTRDPAAPLPAGTPIRIRALPGALTVIAPPAP